MEHQDQLGQSNIGTEPNAKENDPETKKSKQGPRKRVSQACDRCRSRKDKCDGKKPACSTCITNGRQCSYDVNVKKRGLPEGYVRGLEKLWGLAIREVHGVEDNILLVISSGDGNDRFLDIWNDEKNSENLVETWRKSQTSRELERLLSLPEPPSENGKRKRTDSEFQVEKRVGISGVPSTLVADPGNAGPASPAIWIDNKPDIRGQDGFQDSPGLSSMHQSDQSLGRAYESILSPSNHRAVSSNPPAFIPDAPDLPSETWHLLDVYFSYTHAWLPIIEKHDLLRTSYQYSQNRHSLSASGHGFADHAVLWAAIAYAKFQHRAINNIPHAQGPVAEMVWTAERMYTHARSLIPTEEGVLELGHVQALLILGLANLGIGHPSRAWLLIGKAVRIALDLGLDKPSDDILAPLKSKSRAKHVFLGCFALDTIISARLGHRPHLRTHDLDQFGFVEEDGLEEWDPWTDCLSVRRTNASNTRGPASILSTFNNLIQVLLILNEAICISRNSKRVQVSTSLLERLHTWSQSQSSPLYFDSTAIKSDQAMSLLPHHYSLHLTYFSTLAKCQLLSYDYGKESVNLEQSTRSAKQIVEFLKQHSNNFGPLIVPPTFEYFTKAAYDVVREVNESVEDTHIMLNDWKHNLNYCLEAMGPAWPVFEEFKESASFQHNQSTPSGRRESQVAFDLINGMSQAVETPVTHQTPNNYNMPSPQVLRPSTTSANHASKAISVKHSPVSQVSPSFGQSSGANLLTNFQQSPQVIFNPTPGEPWPASNQTQRSRVLPPQHSMSAGSEFEVDPTFQEFATLDATEWSNNWDQSLANLGFTDPDKMNQDFYTMSREPDPLYPNNVFQQLVASSNAEATDFIDGSVFSMGMGAFGGMGFGDVNEGIEAGQILQALSAAEDQRKGRSSG